MRPTTATRRPSPRSPRTPTSTTGVANSFELVAIQPGPDPDSYVATLAVTGNGFNGTNPMTFHPRDELIASLRIS